MRNKIVLNPKHRENLEAVTRWLLTSVGQGSFREQANTWLGTDDWYSFDDVPDMDEDNEDIDIDDIEPNMVFVFRRESDATMFSLKWA